MNYEKEVLYYVKLYYSSEEKALAWYEKKNIHLENECPRDWIESGKGEELLNWVKMVMNYG